MRKTLIFTAVTVLGLAALGAMSPGAAGATGSDDQGEHKVWVCHVVEGRGELKNGYNLIEVDVAAVETEGHLNHVTKDGRKDIIPAPGGATSTCLLPVMPEKQPLVTEWVGTPDCTVQSVTPTRTVTTYSYEYDKATSEWVEIAVVTEEKGETKTLTELEKAACIPKQESLPPVAVTPVVVVTPVVATPVVATPVVETPVVAAAPAVEVAGTTVAAAPRALPATGGETWTIFMVGLATLLVGAGLVTLSRHTA